EGAEHLQALDGAGLLLALARAHLLLEVLADVLEHDARRVLRTQVLARRAVVLDLALLLVAVEVILLAQQLADVLRAHAAAEVLAEAERRAETVLELTEEPLVGDDQLGDELVLLDGLLDVCAERPLLALGRRVLARLVGVGEELPDL